MYPDASFEGRLENIHFIQKKDDVGTCKEGTRANLFPKADRVFLKGDERNQTGMDTGTHEAVNHPVFIQHLVKYKWGKEYDRLN